MVKKLPPALVASIVADRKLAEEQITMFCVLQEGLAQLIAHLHAQGSVNGNAVADSVEQSMSVPELLREMPSALQRAQVLAGRIRSAVSQVPNAEDELHPEH